MFHCKIENINLQMVLQSGLCEIVVFCVKIIEQILCDKLFHDGQEDRSTCAHHCKFFVAVVVNTFDLKTDMF